MLAQGLIVIVRALLEMLRNKGKASLVVIGLVFMVSLSGCGTRAAANDMHVERIYGPDGSTCYVIVQDGRAVGGNCVVTQ